MSELLVADSFRLRANPRTGATEARGLQHHLDRFKWAAFAAWPGEQEVLDRIDLFLDESLPQLAQAGECWPRLELWQDPEGGAPRLALQLRPLPPLDDTVQLRVAGHVQSPHPDRKGPNITRYSALNRELGAEALLLDERGHVLEGATTSLVWWPRVSELSEPDGSDSHQDGANGWVARSPRRVGSVTELLIVLAGGRRLVGAKPGRTRIGQPQPRSVTPAELAHHEVWAVNALHGIRVVTSIDGTRLPDPNARRLRWFREALDRSWEPLAP